MHYSNSPNNLDSWNDPLTEPTKIRDFHQKEFAFFFKDDWKVTNILTLNLGLRWEYYGVPFYKNGLTVGFKGGPGAAYGISGRSWDEAFWKPGDRDDLTELIFVGPESPNPDQRPYPRDFNNFGPAVGFALQLP
ncbi:MAG: TonB-dependent receptor, partial [Acidobacteria bacterium]|nr:TonB-dependent receptor [Acidobacteriota bacterium]